MESEVLRSRNDAKERLVLLEEEICHLEQKVTQLESEIAKKVEMTEHYGMIGVYFHSVLF